MPDALDLDAFHRETLVARAAERGAEAARAARRLGSLALRTPEGLAWTYRPDGDRLHVEPGEARADTRIELDREAWEGIVRELETPPGLLYGGRVRCLTGKAMQFVAWEPALRVLYHGRALYDLENVRLEDRHGRPLDPEQTFRLDDDPAAMEDFLQAAGYLLVREAFSRGEVDAMLREAEELRREAVKGDKLSWWGRNAAGEEVCCRVTRAAAKPTLGTLPTDPRLLRLKSLSPFELTHRRVREGGGEGVTVIYKSPGMTEGLSDLPWHRDCGMGGHAVMCPVLIASLFLTESTPGSGDLRFLPGSWRGAVPFMEPGHPRAPAGARFAARPGDVSLHYSDVMHAAPAPSETARGRYRVSAVTGYARPGARHHRGEKSYNEVLHRREDGQIEHLSRVAERA